MFSRKVNDPTAAVDVADPSPSSQVALVLLAAAVIGVLDAALVVFRIAGAGGAFEFVPARIWIVAPLTWLVVAVLVSGAVLLVTRKRAGVCVAFVIALAFVAIRLRAHPTLLFVSTAALGLTVAAMQSWIRLWMAQPRRLTAFGVLGVLGASSAIVVAHPFPSSPAAMAPAVDEPNVIVIFLDTVRYDAVFDGDGNVHEHLETLSRLRRESTAFTRAYAPSSWTLPSHLSAVTGLAPQELGVSFDSQVYDGSEPTLAERFRQRGYRTAAVISNSFLNTGSGFARGFDTFQQAQAALDLCRTAPGLMAEMHWPWFAAAVCNWTASAVTRRARQLMNDDDRPFFLTLNYMDAHDPYYVERGCGDDHGYRAAIRCLDRNLAPIVDWRSPRRPTVLAVLSDHGEQFGEHGLVRHGNSLHVQVLHVPMMIRPAHPSAPRTCTAPLSIAVLPVLLTASDDTPLPAAPVLGLLHPPGAANLPSEWSAIDASWHLIARERGSDALYNLARDSSEEHDLISTPPDDPAIDRLRAAIQQMRRSPKPDPGKFRSLGYIH